MHHQKQEQLAALERYYTRFFNEARLSDDPVYWDNVVRTERDRERALVKAKYELRLLEIQRSKNEAASESEHLIARQKELNASIPPEE